MQKQRSIVMKLSLLTISSFVILFLIYIHVNNQFSFDTNQTTGEELITVTTEKTAFQIPNQFNETITSLKDEQNILLSFSEQTAASAEEIAASTQEQANEIAKIVPLMNNLHDIATDLKEKYSFFTVIK